MRALKDKEVEKLFGRFDWHDCPNNKGMVVIDDKWRKDNIVHIEHEIPIIGRVTCHKLVLFDIFRIFQRIWEAGFENQINVHDFHRLGGCYVPRHKCWDIHRRLSRHTWGVAVDIKAQVGEEFVKKQLSMDKGANKLGEFSLTDKRFSKINTFMANTLFDENYGGRYGNCHVALGSSYSDTYDGNPAELTADLKKKLGFNDSALHWDFVNTENKRVVAHLTSGKKVAIYENGRFTYSY